jgi:hypothetical protein
MRRRVLLVAAALASGLVAVSIAAATTSLSLTPSTVKPGQSTLVRGNADGCPVGDTVTIISRAFSRVHEFAGVPAVLTRVRAGGAFRVTARIPLTRRAGRYAVTARCGGGNLGVLRYLRVRY